MKTLIFILLIFCFTLHAADFIKPPERNDVIISFTYKGKVYKNYTCKVLCLDESGKFVTIINQSGRALIAEISKESLPTVKRNLLFYEETLKKIEFNNKLIAIEKAKPVVQKKAVARKVKNNEYNALGLTFGECVRKFGSPRGKIKTLEEHIAQGYRSINFYHRGWEIELGFIKNICERARYNKETGHPDTHRRIVFEDIKLLIPANISGPIIGPKNAEEFGTGKSSKQWTNSANNISIKYGPAFVFHDPYLLFETEIWKKNKSEIRKLQREYQKKELQERFNQVKASALKGVVEDQYKLSYLYLSGSGAVKSSFLGVKWLTTAAENGHANAQYTLGKYLYSGQYNVEKNIELAKKWFHKAADQGHNGASNYLTKIP